LLSEPHPREVRMIDTDTDPSDIIYLPSAAELSRLLGPCAEGLLEGDEEVVAVTDTDLVAADDGLRYGREWLVLTTRRLLVVRGGRVAREVKLGDVLSAELRAYLGCLVLSLRTRGGEVSAAAATKGRKEQLERVATLINDMTLHGIPYEFLRRHLAREGKRRARSRASRRGVLLKLLGFARPMWHLVAAASALSIATTLVGLLPPYLMKVLIDEVLVPRDNLDKLPSVILGLLGANASLTALGVARSYVLLRLNQGLAVRLRAAMYERVQRMSLKFHDRFPRGAIMSRILDDVNRVLYFLTQGISNMLLDAAMMAFVGAIMLSMSPQLSCVALLPVPASIAGTALYRRVMPKYYHKMWRKWSNVVSTLSESLSAVALLKALGRERDVVAKFRESLDEFVASNAEVFKNEQKFWPLIGLSFTVSNLLVWWMGGLQVLSGSLTLGTLTAFVSYMWQFYRPVNDLANHLRLVQHVVVAGERMFEVLEAEPEEAEGEGGRDVEIVGRVELRDVWFTYDGVHYALKGVSLTVEPGEHVGIVGPSGSGKTTLTKLLLRLYDPQRGRVLIDGTDVREVRPECLRRQVAVVMQNPILLNASIAENIAVGKEGATLEEVIAAAKAARAHDFIMKLPEAYDTEVGSCGGRLSGGERQRIAIAAALLRDPKILILDEPTSSLDALTERDVTEAIENLTRNRTTIVIAHRLSTLRRVDKIVVLDKGVVVEQGTHDELMRAEGLYRRLFEAQFAGFAEGRRVVAR